MVSPISVGEKEEKEVVKTEMGKLRDLLSNLGEHCGSEPVEMEASNPGRSAGHRSLKQALYICQCDTGRERA